MDRTIMEKSLATGSLMKMPFCDEDTCSQPPSKKQRMTEGSLLKALKVAKDTSNQCLEMEAENSNSKSSSFTCLKPQEISKATVSILAHQDVECKTTDDGKKEIFSIKTNSFNTERKNEILEMFRTPIDGLFFDADEEKKQAETTEATTARLIREVKHLEKLEHGNNDTIEKQYQVESKGIHANTIHDFSLIAMSSLLPSKAQKDRKARCSPLPLLERLFGGKRPQLKDLTVEGYVKRCWLAEKLEWHDLTLGPPKTNRQVPYAGLNEKYIAYEWKKTVKCARCSTILQKTNKGALTKIAENAKSFKVCCYNALKTKKYSLNCLKTNIEKVITIPYDMECYPVTKNDGNEYHEFYCIGYILPDGREKCSTHLAEFFKDIAEQIQIFRDASVKKMTVLHLISFNGSRYDDIFLSKPWRNFIIAEYGIKTFADHRYAERKRAITQNTITVDNVTVEFCDVLRFTSPTSLAKAAKDYGLAEQKGSMPFAVLNDYCTNKKVARDADGFFSLSYYKYDEKLRKKSFEYYQELFPRGVEQSNNTDVRAMCFAYCLQDVKVTLALYNVLKNMYVKYLTPLIVPDCESEKEIETAENVGFFPMLLTSLSSMAARVMMHIATNQKHWIRIDPPLDVNYSDNTTEPTWTVDVPEIFCPIEETYTFERKAIYGGWVKPYFQGFLIDSSITEVGDVFFSTLKKIADEFKIPTIDKPHVMGDIASMYPVGVTFPMPVGQPTFILEEELKQRLLQRLYNAKKCTDIPMFVARVKMIVPTRPYFFESTLPQRGRDGHLSWTYDQALADEWHYYTSLDLYLACVQSKVNGDEQSVWKISSVREMIYYPKCSQIYKPFMIKCAEGKLEGAKNKNLSQRTCFKICMNGSIGKLGQNAVGQVNLLGKQNYENYIESFGDECELVGINELNYKKGYLELNNTEYILKTTSTANNNWPQIHGAFMYAATRIMRHEWSRAVMKNTLQPIKEMKYPDPFYGDTDSKVHLTEHWNNIPETMVGNTVGVFDIDSGISNQNIELESVSNGTNVTAFFSGFLGAKCYFICGWDSKNQKVCVKFKCKGQRQFDRNTHGCRSHGHVLCEKCICEHGSDIQSCPICIIMHFGNDGSVLEPDADYKYAQLPNIALCDFLRVLITGRPCKTTNECFDRILSNPTTKIGDFSIVNSNVTRTLSKPKLFTSVAETETVKPLVPLLKDLVEIPTGSGILLPTGTYLTE